MDRPILHDYYRSSAAYRVRIALNLKGVAYDSRPVNLANGAQKSEDYRALNPQGFVPMLEIDGLRLTQSLSIIMYLASRFPEPPLLPEDAGEAAHVRGMALAIACDIHPLNNLRVLKYLKTEFGQPQEAVDAWYAHWITEGLAPLEAVAAPRAGAFLFGDAPTIADICLVPQLYNARRFNVRLDDYPTLLRADGSAAALDAFAAAHPDRQEKSE
ncbi:MAG: maleylacetoacetate isomerase [Sphingomonas sp.]|nr:maleylacetoacetate isomerase [Sphingomonas sp.]